MTDIMQTYFFELVDWVRARLTGDEVLLAEYSGEESDFVRFNHGSVRQAGNVVQRYVALELIVDQRHARATTTLTGEAASDRPRCEALLGELRAAAAQAPEDPYLLYSTEVRSTEQVGANRLPPAEAVVDAVVQAGRGRDLVGILAQGAVWGGFANSLGQRNWFASHSFNLDWSFYHAADKAVKTNYAGAEWDPARFDAKVESAARQLAALSRPPRTIEPGPYRVYLAPSALDEFMGMVCYGGFSLKAHRTKTTPLLRMIEAGAVLSSAVTLTENVQDGLAPNFQSAGFVKPDRVELMRQGRLAECLVSPRSAREYGLACNGASDGECPESLEMAGGDLADNDILNALDTGVYVNNLWYLNYSDRPAGRITGMTRFATFWVEGGQIAAPLNVMRFDETIFRVLGDNLLGLTERRDLSVSTSTYGGRSTASIRLPGALVKDFAFTL